MLRTSSQWLDTIQQSQKLSTYIPVSTFNKWTVKIYHHTGGLKKQWILGNDDCPITSLKFENNLKGCGSATITFAYMPITIDADDIVDIFYDMKKQNNQIDYYDETRKYRGIVDIKPDVKGGDVTFVPLWQRLDETFFGGSYDGSHVSANLLIDYTTENGTGVLYDIIHYASVNLVDSVNIQWAKEYINIGDTNPNPLWLKSDYTKTFVTRKKAIDDLINGYTDGNRYWGVDENGFFYVKEFSNSDNSIHYYYTDEPAYSDITVTTDFSGVKMTRGQVSRKATASDTPNSGNKYVGEVGYGGSYPILPIEKLIRAKEGTIVAPDAITDDTQALKYGYALLKSYAPIENIQVNNVDLTKWQPTVGELVTVQDRDFEEMTTICDCESLQTDDYTFCRNFNLVPFDIIYLSSDIHNIEPTYPYIC